MIRTAMPRSANTPNIIATRNRLAWGAALLALLIVVAAGFWLGGLFGGAKRLAGFGSNSAVPASGGARFPIADAPEFTTPPRAEVSEEEAAVAKVLNAATPANPGAIVAAKPFSMNNATATDRLRALECLAAAVYYEASSESVEGQRAVAQVVLNRVRHPIYPGTVCDVVFQGHSRITGCQFTFTCDGSLVRPRRGGAWALAVQIAQAGLDGFVTRSVGTATHYHADWVAPWWRTTLTKLNTLGAHIFYRWKAGTGSPAAFSRRYGGGEPDTALLFGAAQPDPSLIPVDMVTFEQPTQGSADIVPQQPVIPVKEDALRAKPAADSHGALVADERAGSLKN